jgi:hypothetical protein
MIDVIGTSQRMFTDAIQEGGVLDNSDAFRGDFFVIRFLVTFFAGDLFVVT